MYQQQPQQPNEGFAKRSQNVFLTDNKSDEMMCNVLELYPQKRQYIFQGKDGQIKRKQLYNKVRKKFNMACEEDGYAEFGKGKKKDRKGLKKIGRAIKTAALAPARGAFLALLRINFRGLASRFNLLNEKGQKKLFDKWDKLGGKKDALERGIDAGKGKKPLACGKKCRAKAGKNPQLPTSAQSDFANAAGVDDAALISAAAGIISALVKTVGDKSNYKSQIELAKLQNDIDKADADEKKVDDAMTPQEKALADEIIKAQEGSFDAVKAITDNPNLTAEEKQAALLALKEDVEDDSTKRNVLIVVGVIAALGIGYYFYQRTNTN